MRQPLRIHADRSATRLAVAFGLALTVTATACAHRSAVEPGASGTEPARAEATVADKAVNLYDEGRYDEARVLLEQLDAEGKLTGPLLYRLGFCHGQALDAKGQTEFMQRALVELQKEAATGDSLEVSFFLANALNNVDRAADARKVAADATTRIENGTWPKPAQPIDQFRLAKLYQDQGRTADAVPHYRAALAQWELVGAQVPGYQKWSRRYLGQDSIARADFRQAEADFRALTSLGGASASDFDRLAVCRVRVSDWQGAADAWREAEKLDPANSDRPRYCRNLALLAATAGTLPSTNPKGTAWTATSTEDLEATMANEAKTLRDARTEAAAGITPQRKAELEKTVSTAKGNFAAAGLEYAARYLDIRQTAFTGGYAPLIFHPEEWTAEPPS